MAFHIFEVGSSPFTCITCSFDKSNSYGCISILYFYLSLDIVLGSRVTKLKLYSMGLLSGDGTNQVSEKGLSPLPASQETKTKEKSSGTR